MTFRQVWKHRSCAVLFVGFLGANAAIAAPTLLFSTSAVPSFGGSVTLNLSASDVTDLYAWQFSLNFDPTFFTVSGGTEGPFLASGGATFFDLGVIDNAAGKISFAFDTLLGAAPGVSGSGVIARYTFAAKKAGSSAISFSDVAFLNSAFRDIPIAAPGGSIVTIPEPAAIALVGIGLAGVGLSRRRTATTA